MTAALEGLRAIDFSLSMAGAVATMILADYGVGVIKVEPPGGDPLRAQPAFYAWNRGKKSVVLDLKTDAGLETAQQLAGQADVVMESFRPGVADRLGIGYEALSAGNPRLVYCSITGFGSAGPYTKLKGYDGIVAAKVGRFLQFSAMAKREGPVFAAVPAASFGASQTGLQGVLAALYLRERTGQGQHVRTSLLQALTAYDLGDWLGWQLAQRNPQTASPAPSGGRGGPAPGLIYLVACTADGYWLQFAQTAPHLFFAWMKAIGLEHLYQDERYRTLPNLPPEERVAVWEMILRRMAEKPLKEWQAIFEEEPDISAEIVRTTEEGLQHRQMLHNGQVIESEQPDVGRIKQVGPLVHMAATPGGVQGPAPLLNQHAEEVTRRASESRPDIEPGKNGAAMPASPLEGITVLELAGYYAAPFGTNLLADLGARVIKIEPLEGDPMRSMGSDQLSTSTVKTTQGKESIAVDLKTPEGKEIVHKLVARADLLMHNYRPGVPERLGIDYQTLRAINPRLVYLYAGSYGPTGPDAKRPAYDPTPGAVVGNTRYQYGEGLPPRGAAPEALDELKRVSARLNIANWGFGDPSSAIVVGTALLLGLLARERTGKGQEMMTTMLCSNAYTSTDFLGYDGKPERQLPDADLYGLGPIYRLYRAREGWIFLACLKEKEWEALCIALDRPELKEDARFRTPTARRGHSAELAAILEEAFSQRDADGWEAYLSGFDVACVRADKMRFGEFANVDPGMEANGFVAQVEAPILGLHRRHGPTVQLSKTGARMGPSCLLGQHTRQILAELGYGEEQTKGLKTRRVVTGPDETWLTRAPL